MNPLSYLKGGKKTNSRRKSHSSSRKSHSRRKRHSSRRKSQSRKSKTLSTPPYLSFPHA